MKLDQGLFGKEFRGTVTAANVNIKKSVYIALFLGLLSFGIHYFLKTLSDSVLAETFPEFMTASYFSVAYIYLAVSLFFFVIYFAYYYDYLTFNEIRQNRWYVLCKMGYSPTRMILTKYFVRVGSVFVIYTIGYIVALVVTALLRYPFIFPYILTLYISGLVDLFFIVTFMLFISLVTDDKVILRIFMAIGLVVLYIIRHISNYYLIFRDRVAMANYNTVFSSPYIYILLGAIVIFFIATIFYGRVLAQMYTPKSEFDTAFLVKDYRTHHFVKSRVGVRFGGKLVSKLINGIGVTLLAFALLVNAFLLVLSFNSANEEFAIGRYIPYIFQSTTMTPDIANNDFVLLRQVTSGEEVKVDDIVIFRRNDEAYIEKIQSFNDDGTIIVDINYYPETATDEEKTAMRFTIARSDIYGVYFTRSRWVGLILLFANDTFGRIIMFLIPVLILFFEKQITEYLEKSRRVYSDVQVKEKKLRHQIDYYHVQELESDVNAVAPEKIDYEIMDKTSMRRLQPQLLKLQPAAPVESHEDNSLKSQLEQLRRQVEGNVKKREVPHLDQQPTSSRKLTKGEVAVSSYMQEKGEEKTTQSKEEQQKVEVKKLKVKVDKNAEDKFIPKK
ncbi:MAG: hypothetical protein PHY11_02215 [Bacilli bacterium]|nr:hypothetical protein [Bacilli bacterium]MDD3422313.1 hypothetical protein [Bacilli bacterium]MDD4065797.1 hypothetical protein [Bacilli bacterium]